MLYIKLDEDMSLNITVNEPIYRGDRLNQKIIYLIPLTVGDIDVQSATVYLSYIRADGTADIALLTRMDETYNESYYQYTLPVTSTLTRYAGEVCSWLQIYAGPSNDPMIAKSGECMLHILASKNMDEYISDRNLSLIYAMQKQMEEKVEQTEKTLTERLDKTDEAVAAKADNIVFNAENSTIQLVSTIILKDEDGNETGTEQVPLGDPIYVRADASRGISDMKINDDGELVVTFDDGTEQNLGVVVGADGAVYVPHISEQKVLTWTIETEPGDIPDEVDMNPDDEWSNIDESDGVTTYVWDTL